jgi:hypothetical protein
MRGRSLQRSASSWLLIVAFLVSWASARAQTAETSRTLPPRRADFTWDSSAQRRLYMSVGFRDAVDTSIRQKLTRGLPTTIVMAASIYVVGRTSPVATTAQSCKIVWHVWEEAYRLEIHRPGERPQPTWTTTMEGVLRRCAEANRLLAGARDQIPLGRPIYAVGQVQVNPISADVLAKIKRWVSRPSGTSTAAPGDALFSTFTGLFLQRIGHAERHVKFQTLSSVPTVPP